ncbi:MAG TPA: hypothetical protein VFH70_00285 [Acidimicrobiales bacterium]|nr:hypothetical protein [Acidimicrobiales bacterium]
MKARLLLVPLATVVALAGSSGDATAASSGPSVQSGWWNEAAVGPVQAPSTTPANQLQVSYGGSSGSSVPGGFKGTLAFSAVRITLPPGTPASDVVSLKLTIPSSSSVGTVAVSACPTTSNWKPGANQPPKSAPGYSCKGRQADGKATAADETWAIPASWASGADVSVALIPSPGTTSPFSISYNQPTAASVTLEAPAAPGSVRPVSEPAVPFSPSPSGLGSTSSGVPASPAPVSPASGSAVSASGSPAAAPSLGSLGSGSAASGSNTPSNSGTSGAPASAAPGGGTPVSTSHGRGGRIMAFVLLVGLAVALFGLSAQSDRPPQLLGPLGARPAGARSGFGGSRTRQVAFAAAAEVDPYQQVDPARPAATPVVVAAAPVRGIGRFARPRLAPPKRL